MQISVIIPFFNEEEYIGRCAQALLDQDFDKDQYEVIFVDNGSTDRSAEIVSRFSKFTLLREERGETYTARNLALRQARGQIIALTDADCVVCRDWLKKIYEGMSRCNATIALGKRFFPPASSLALRLFEDYENAKLEYISAHYPEKFSFGNGNNMAIRAEAFKRFGDFIEYPNMGDTEFVYRCVSRDPDTRVVYLPDMEVTHLEVTGLNVWLGKMFYYGELGALAGRAGHYKPFRKDAPNRAINSSIRLEMYDYCCRKNNYGSIKRAFSFILLSIGLAYFKIGGIKGRRFDKTT